MLSCPPSPWLVSCIIKNIWVTTVTNQSSFFQVAQKTHFTKKTSRIETKALQRLGCKGKEAQPDAAAEPGTMAAAGARPAVPSMELLRVAENRIEMVQPAHLPLCHLCLVRRCHALPCAPKRDSATCPARVCGRARVCMCACVCVCARARACGGGSGGRPRAETRAPHVAFNPPPAPPACLCARAMCATTLEGCAPPRAWLLSLLPNL